MENRASEFYGDGKQSRCYLTAVESSVGRLYRGGMRCMFSRLPAEKENIIMVTCRLNFFFSFDKLQDNRV